MKWTNCCPQGESWGGHHDRSACQVAGQEPTGVAKAQRAVMEDLPLGEVPLGCPFHWGGARAVVEGMARHWVLQGDQECHSLQREEIKTTHRDEFLGSFEQFHVTLGKLAPAGVLERGHTDCKKWVWSNSEGSPVLNKQDCHPDRSSRAEVRKQLACEHLPHGDLPQLLPEPLRACPHGFLKRGRTTQHLPLTRLTLLDESCWSSPHCLDLTVGVQEEMSPWSHCPHQHVGSLSTEPRLWVQSRGVVLTVRSADQQHQYHLLTC